jgi:hypothetical protein
MRTNELLWISKKRNNGNDIIIKDGKAIFQLCWSLDNMVEDVKIRSCVQNERTWRGY